MRPRAHLRRSPRPALRSGGRTPPLLETYINTLYADPDFQAWQTAAKAEPWTVEEADALYG